MLFFDGGRYITSVGLSKIKWLRPDRLCAIIVEHPCRIFLETPSLNRRLPYTYTCNDERGIILEYSDQHTPGSSSSHHHSQPQDRALALILQQLSLTPQRISLEPPESRLDPISALAITTNLLPGPERSRQKPHLSEKENTSAAQQSVSCDVAESAGLHGSREIGEGLLFARGEAQGHGLLGGAESLEDCCAVAADSEGEQGAECEAEEGADCCVCGDGACGFAKGVAV
jgi:hypothetical protein